MKVIRSTRWEWFVVWLVAAACSRSVTTPSPSSPAADSPSGAAAAGAAGAEVSAARLEEETFFSEALGVEKKYLVWLPAGYDDRMERRYPVLYYLHGLGGNETNWTKLGKLDAVAAEMDLQAIVVMPDGDDSFYLNWAEPPDFEACKKGGGLGRGKDPAGYCVKRGRYEDYITKDLIGHVDDTYRTDARREARGIAGLSMGGFGALMLGLRHTDLYAAAASHSGWIAILYGGPRPYQKGKVKTNTTTDALAARTDPLSRHLIAVFGRDIARWRAHDPATLVQSLKPGTIAIYLDCGDNDSWGFHDQAQYVHDLLTERGIPHDYALLPGRHDFRFWRDRIDDSLHFFRTHLNL